VSFLPLAASISFALPALGLPTGYPSVKIDGVSGQVDMPLFGIGTWEYNDTLAEAAVTTAFSLGYRHVDTAYIYENQVGVGRALKKSGVSRGDFFVTTKIFGGLNSSEAAKALDKCLEDLQLDYVDLMLLHFPASTSGTGGAALRKEEWLALEKWAKAGKAKAIGISHYCKRQVEDIQSVATLPIAVNQVQYHVGMGSAGDYATDFKIWVQSQGILFESFSPLCGPCGHTDHMKLINGRLVSKIGKAHNKTGSQVSLRWLVQQGIPVIPKSSVKEHQQENMDIFDFELTAEEMVTLTASKSPPVGGGPSPTDSGDCGVVQQIIV